MVSPVPWVLPALIKMPHLILENILERIIHVLDEILFQKFFLKNVFRNTLINFGKGCLGRFLKN